MSEVLERAKGHFKERLSAPMRYVECAEWAEDDEPLKIYYKPSTLEQRDRIYKHLNAGTLKFIVQTLIERALDENGKPMFKRVEMNILMKQVDPNVVEYIINEIANDDDNFEAGDIAKE